MMKRISVLLLAAVMVIGMTACGKKDDVKTGVEDGTLTVGFDAEYPPYGYMDENGEYTGFDLELAEAVCEKEGWKL